MGEQLVTISIYISFKEVPEILEEEFLLKVKDKLSSAFSEYEEFKLVFKFVVY